MARKHVDLGSQLESYRQRLKRPRPLVRACAVYLQRSMQQAFRLQRRGLDMWPASMEPRVPNIIERLNRGLNPAARNFRARPAAVDTNTLSRDINILKLTDHSAEVGSRLEYADRINEGGISTVLITKAGARQLWKWGRKKANKARYRRIAYLFTYAREKRPMVINVRPRPFAVVTAEDEKRFAELTDRYLLTGRA